MDIIYKKTSQTEEIILVGAIDKGIVVSLAPKDSYFGIRFKPSILSFVLNQNMYKYWFAIHKGTNWDMKFLIYS